MADGIEIRWVVNTIKCWVGCLGVIVGLVWGASACTTESSESTAVPVVPTTDTLSTLIAMQRTSTPVPSNTPLPTVTATPSPTPTITPSVTASMTPTPTATPSVRPSATSLTALPVAGAASPTATASPGLPTPFPTNTPRSTQVVLETVVASPVPGASFDQTGEIRDHYWLERPFPRDPSNTISDYASRSYPYGSTGGGQFQTHHGVDIQNVLETPILATANGTVFYAGDDSAVMFGPNLDFYGNLVVIAHDRPAPDGRPLYTLYGHMSRVDVATGQRVEVREPLGQVGATGVALGSHLHLEVRIGDPYDYNSTYNPDLWVKPWREFGTLAGRIFDREGNRLYDAAITVQVEGGLGRTAYSYADEGVNSDPYYAEHFTYADLPEGEYQVLVRVRGVLRFKDTVTITGGQTSWIIVRLN